MTDDPVLKDAIRRALGVANSGLITLVPKPTNITDLRTGKAWYPPGSLARSLQKDDPQ
jgi:hypothetical protein